MMPRLSLLRRTLRFTSTTQGMAWFGGGAVMGSRQMSVCVPALGRGLPTLPAFGGGYSVGQGLRQRGLRLLSGGAGE
eukprot:CAMPEP_0173423886 /NCGR_PEP_ID=MMETSP1357-20121228/3999_1 /TAXON_ID=77926 /ORGANISM="Hemiselmis rufescens, Strain PCC563" /LENGTH=76 /DNA_ID=CAMNT_0014387043 /DNA_START=81 /DNA_END=308 /DNA_ORIENTATION=+